MPLPQRRTAMTSQGTAAGRFTRAIQRGHLFAAEMAAREMGHLSLSNALSLCILYRREQDPKFDRAAVRWVRRMQLEWATRNEPPTDCVFGRPAIRSVGEYPSRDRSRRPCG
jgi:hypothetical protein